MIYPSPLLILQLSLHVLPRRGRAGFRVDSEDNSDEDREPYEAEQERPEAADLRPLTTRRAVTIPHQWNS